VNYAGVALIVLSTIFFIIEIYVTSHGLATIGGVIALVFGSVILFNSSVPFLRVSWEVIMLVAIIIVAFVVLMLIMGIGAQFRKPASGKEGMVGESGIAKTEIDPEGGTVFVHGEFWNAVSDKPIKKNSRVKVVSASGVLLKVEPL
jgi:membrane-bound serine protease (ClpP class)